MYGVVSEPVGPSEFAEVEAAYGPFAQKYTLAEYRRIVGEVDWKYQPAPTDPTTVKDAVNANAGMLGFLCHLAVVADREAVTVWKTT